MYGDEHFIYQVPGDMVGHNFYLLFCNFIICSYSILHFFLVVYFLVICQFLGHQGKLNPFVRGTNHQTKAMYGFQISERGLLLTEHKCPHSLLLISSNFMCQVLF